MLKSWCAVRRFLMITVLFGTSCCEIFAQLRSVTKVLFVDPILDKNTVLYDSVDFITSIGDNFHKIDFRIPTDNGLKWVDKLPVGGKIKHSFNQYTYDKIVSQHKVDDQKGNLFLNIKDKEPPLRGRFYIVDEKERTVSQEIHNPKFVVLDEKQLKYAIQGIVTDQNSNQPIANATVVATCLNDKNNWITYTAVSDASGSYRLEVPVGDYIVNCKVLNGMMSSCYSEQYYQNTSDRTQASVLIVTNNKEGIDFSLTPCSQESNRVTGMVVNNTNMPIPSSVVAFRLPESNEGLTGMVIRSSTAQDGNFTFEKLITGNYIFFAFPSAVPAVPGFYKVNDFASLEWQKATIVNVTVHSTSQIIIKLRDLRSMEGKGMIRGWVGKDGGNVKEDNILAGVPMHGAIVYAIDENGDVRDFGLTNEDGRFAITTLDKGKYTLRIERVGYEPSVTEEVIEGEMSIIDVSRTLAPAITSDITEENGKSEIIVKPNPSGMITTIEFPMDKAQECTITISDIIGNKVLTEKIQGISGLNTHTVNTHTLPSGQYHIRIESEAGIRSVPLTIVR